jgi:uncharacterized protein (TIGR02145 family)
LKRLFYLLCLFFISGQGLGQIDNNFWFVAPEVSSNHGDRPVYMRISTMTDTANILLRMPANLFFTPVTRKINPNSSFSIDLTPWIDAIENKPADAILNCGLQLTSDNNITAYYEVANTLNPAVSSMKGKNGMGTEFFISGQTGYSNQTNDGSEAFDIVASEDNTTVLITPSLAITGHPAGVTFQVILNKGQTYSARTTNITAAASLAGSHVVSDKPIAITIFDDSIITGGWDEIADQTVPVNILGWDYIVIKGFADNAAGNNDEHVFILATKDNTEIFLNGSALSAALLNTGMQYDYPIPPTDNTVRVRATNPVYVYHLSGHAGEAGSAIIPQDSCTGSTQVGFTRTTADEFALLILTRNGNQGAFFMNGDNSIITPADFNVVPGTGNAWVYFRKNLLPVSQVPVGANQISNTSGKFHLGILNKGSGGSSEYGYFSDFSSLYLGADKSMCPGDSIILDGGFARSTYEWRKLVSGTWVITGTSRFFVVQDSGYYAVMTNGDFCELRDTIHISLYQRAVASLGPDTTLCQGTPITLDPGPFVSYLWQNNSTGRFFTTSVAGLYWVEVTNNNGCKARDTVVIAIDSLPKAAGSIAGLATVCQGQNGVVYSVPPFPFASTYDWTLPSGASGASTANSITLDFSVSAASDTLRVKGHNICGFGPELKLPITVDPLPVAAGMITGPGSVCPGQTGAIFSVSPVNFATSFRWVIPSGASVVSGAGTNTITVNFSFGAVSGNISVNGTNSCGDGPSSSFPVVLYSIPVPSISGPASVCLNSTTTYTAAPGMTGYSWTVSPGGAIVAGNGTGSIDVLWSSTGTKTITLNYTDGNGCTALTPSPYTVTVSTLPVPSLGGINSICSGLPATYTTDAGMSNYSWTVSAGGTVTAGGGPADNSVTVNWNTAGPQTVSVNYIMGTGCTATTPSVLNVTVKPRPLVTNASNSALCSNGTTGIVPAASLLLTTFSWTANGSSPNVYGFSASAGPVIAQTLQNSGFIPETVTYSVTPSLNGCDGPPAPFIVTVNPVADVFFSPNGQTFCSGTTSGIILQSNVALTSFTYTAAGSSVNVSGFGPGNASPIAQTLVNTGPAPESVTYTVTPSFSGCTGTSGNVVVTVNPNPPVSYALCNDPVTTTAAQPFKLAGGLPLGGTYSGTGTSAGFFFPALAGTGNHTITYSSINTWGCTASANLVIPVTVPAAFTCNNPLTDIRDNRQYATVKIGTQCWMAENLNNGNFITSAQMQRDNCLNEKYCFNDNLANCNSYGGLYQWDEMMRHNTAAAGQGLCPPGWHVPVENDWATLFNFYISNGFAGSPLKYTGYSGFNAFLSGTRFINMDWDFNNFAAMFWSSTAHGPDKAWAHGMNTFNPSVSYYPSAKTNAFNVRCIKD